MSTEQEPRELPGTLSPDGIAAELGWPPELVQDLIRIGSIRRSGDRFIVDAGRELLDRWARAQWTPPSEENGDGE